jgi:hypothetical protein
LSTFGITEVKDFLTKLHSREYMIDGAKAEKISYNNGTLAQVLSDSLSEFETIFRAIPIPHPSVIDKAYNAITAAFTHDVVIDKNDIRKTLRETEELLKRYEEDKVALERNNNELRQELIRCENLKKALQDLLSQQQSESDDKHD